MINKAIITTIALAASVVGAAEVSAATVYTDKIEFLNTTFAESVSGSLPGAEFPIHGSRTVGDVTITSGRWGFDDRTSVLEGTEIVISNGLHNDMSENLDIELANSSVAFGFDIYEVSDDSSFNGTFVDSVFSVSLFDGNNLVNSFEVNAPDNVASFFGFVADSSFDSVEIREIIGNNDNEYFGQLYASEQMQFNVINTVVVPSPVASGMGIALLSGLVVVRKRRH